MVGPSLVPFHGQTPSQPTYKTLSQPSLPPHCGHSFLSLPRSLYIHFPCAVHCKSLTAVQEMDPISIEKIRAMRKYRGNRKQQQLLPALTPYLVATCGVLCLLLTSPAWFPSLCSLLVSFLLTTLPDLATAFLLSPKCLFVVGNLIVAFLIGESRLGGRSRPDSLVDVDDVPVEHVKRNVAPTTAKATTATTVVFSDHGASVEAIWVGEKEEEVEEEQVEEELEKRVDDFIARVKKQRKLEGKSFFDTDR